jgi:peptide/nickel transport system ATP-binding protein
MTALALPPIDSNEAEDPAKPEIVVELIAVSKRFESRPDFAARMVGMVGGKVAPRVVHALDAVSLRIRAGEVVGLVGESGCGKSTLGRIVANIYPPSDGDVLYRNRNVANLRGPEAQRHTRAVQMVFQDPFASLNPRMRIDDIIGEAPVVHGLVAQNEAEGLVDSYLAKVGLDPSAKDRFPHQFSGGQRQRICIARALAVQPELLVCDEAVAALDVSIQAQILNLFMDLREELGLTYLFISHDLGVVQHLSDRIVIMYLGRVVETATTEELFARPNHPYTQALLAELPRLDGERRSWQPVQGEIPSPLAPPRGCHFHPRCPHALPRCAVEAPALREIAPGHRSACHLNDAPRALPHHPDRRRRRPDMDADIRDEPLLLTPGPCSISRSVKEAMLKDLASGEEVMVERIKHCRDYLLKICNGGGTHTTIPLVGSGTYATEAAIGTFVPRDGKLLIHTNGVYGDRVIDICEGIKIPYKSFRTAPYTLPTAKQFEKEIMADPGDHACDDHPLRDLDRHPQPRRGDRAGLPQARQGAADRRDRVLRHLRARRQEAVLRRGDPVG